MTNKNKINISFKATQLEGFIFDNIVNYHNKNKNTINKITKSIIIRELILKEFIRIHDKDFKTLGININDLNEVLNVINDLGLDNFE